MAAGNLIGVVPAWLLIRRIGLRRSLLVCQVAAPVVLCFRAVTVVFWLQCGLSILTGMCLCLWAVSLSPMTASLTDEKDRSTAFSLLFSLGIGVGAAGGLMGSRMPGWFGGLPIPSGFPAPDQMTLIAAAILAMVGVFFTIALREQSTPTTSRAAPFLSPHLMRFLPAVAAWGFVTGAFSPFANVYFAQHVHIPLVHIGNIFSASQLFQVIAVLAAPVLFRRAGINNGILIAQVVACACLLALSGGSTAFAAGCVYVVLTGAQWMSEPGIYTTLMSLASPEERSGASASMALVLSSAQLIAAVSAGWSYTTLGYPRSLAILAGLALLTGVLFKFVPTGQGVSLPLDLARLSADD